MCRRIIVHVHFERFHFFDFVRQCSSEVIRLAETVNSDAPSIHSMQKGLSVVINTNSCLFSSRYRFKISQCTVPDFGYSLSASKSSAVITGTFRLSSDVGPHHPQTRTPPGRADGSQQIEQFEP